MKFIGLSIYNVKSLGDLEVIFFTLVILLGRKIRQRASVQFINYVRYLVILIKAKTVGNNASNTTRQGNIEIARQYRLSQAVSKIQNGNKYKE